MQTAIKPIPAPSTAITDPAWLRFEQPELTSDTATVSETADLLDALYSLDPCSQVETTVDQTADLAETAAATLSLAACSKEYDGSVVLALRVYRSHPEQPYILRVSGGSLIGQAQTIQTEVLFTLTVEQRAHLTLEVPVLGDFQADWLGAVANSKNSTLSPDQLPEIKRQGNTLFWSGQLTGTLQVSCRTEFDLVSLRVAGVDGAMGQATLRGFFQEKCTVFEPEMPDPAEEVGWSCPGISWQADPSPDQVECYEIVELHKRCSCSGKDTKNGTYERVVPCPQWAPTRCSGTSSSCRHLLGTVVETEYANCEEDSGYAVADPEFYKDQCCEYPSVSLPQCSEHTKTYQGGQPIEKGEPFWRQLYGEKTRFVPVSPEGGCGQHITRQLIEPEDCCDQIAPLLWDNVNSISVIQDNDEGFVYITDGKGPFTWRLISDRGYVWFAGSGSSVLVTEERWAKLVSGAYPCGEYTVEVTDDCGTVVTGTIVSGVGQWILEQSPTGHDRWTLTEFAANMLPLPISGALVESVSFVEGNNYGFGGVMMHVVVNVSGQRWRFEQWVGMKWYQYDNPSVAYTNPFCLASETPITPEAIPFPSSIPSQVGPATSDPDLGYQEYVTPPGAVDATAQFPEGLEVDGDWYYSSSIWDGGDFTPYGLYNALTRRPLYDIGAIGFMGSAGQLPTCHYEEVNGENELIFAYESDAGGDGYGDCCTAGQTCYWAYFGYLITSTELYVYRHDC